MGPRREAFRLLYRIYRSKVLPRRVFPVMNSDGDPDADLNSDQLSGTFLDGGLPGPGGGGGAQESDNRSDSN